MCEGEYAKIIFSFVIGFVSLAHNNLMEANMNMKVISVRISEKLLKEIEKHRENETEFETLSDFIRVLLRRELRRGKEGER